VRLINADGEQVGVVPTPQAMQMAQETGMDLVEVAPQAKPPVCKIMDYGKWKYAQKKKEHKSKKKHHGQELKEVRLRPKTDLHDQQIKLRHARQFLEDGYKVQFTMLFRGRERLHQDIGREIFIGIADQLSDVGKVERESRLEGRRMTMVIAPLPSIKQSSPQGKATPAGRETNRQTQPPGQGESTPQKTPAQTTPPQRGDQSLSGAPPC